MPAPKEVTEKHRARLGRLPANSGHAKVLRAKLGIAPPVPVLEPEPVVEEPTAKKKSSRRKKK